MQSKVKIIALAGSALLAATFGAYMFVSSSDESVVIPYEAGKPSPAEADLETPVADIETSEQAANKETVQKAEATVEKPQTAAVPAASQATGKLTKEQLMPPVPKTEAEKLQKAAEQEYDRF